MTPKFTTPCYVRVDDKDKRREVCEELQEMGYAMNFLPKTLGFSTRNSVLVNGKPFYGEYRKPSCFLLNHRAGLAKLTGIEGWQFINCGTNIDLFLALAGMRSDTDMRQLFIDEDENIFTNNTEKYNGPREVTRLTAAEIIEHFKTK